MTTNVTTNTVYSAAAGGGKELRRPPENRWVTILMWVAIWVLIVIGLRLMGWGIGFACEESICKFL